MFYLARKLASIKVDLILFIDRLFMLIVQTFKVTQLFCKSKVIFKELVVRGPCKYIF